MATGCLACLCFCPSVAKARRATCTPPGLRWRHPHHDQLLRALAVPVVLCWGPSASGLRSRMWISGACLVSSRLSTATPCSQDDWSLRIAILDIELSWGLLLSAPCGLYSRYVCQDTYDRRVPVSSTGIPLQLAACLLTRALPVPRTVPHAQPIRMPAEPRYATQLSCLGLSGPVAWKRVAYAELCTCPATHCSAHVPTTERPSTAALRRTYLDQTRYH